MLGKLRGKLEGDRHLKDLIKGSATFFVIRVLGLLVAYAFTLFVTRKLGASAWGIFTICFTILQIVSAIGRLGLDTALLRFIAQYNAQGRREAAKYIYLKSISVVIPFSLLLSGGLYLLAPVLAGKIFGKEYLTPYIRLIAFAVLPFTLLYINSESLRALKRILEYAVCQNLLPFLVALLIIAGLFFFYDEIHSLRIFIIIYVISIIISVLVSLIFIEKEFRKKGTFKMSISHKHFFSIYIFMFASNSLNLMLSWTDTIMLGIFRSEEEVGIYSVVLRILLPFSIVWVAINSISAPKFAVLSDNKKSLQGVVTKSTNLLFLISLSQTLIIFSMGEYILEFFGKEFGEGKYALFIISIGYLIKSFFGLSIDLMNMTNMHKYLFFINLSTFVLNIFINFIMIPVYGIVGAATSTMVSICVSSIARFIVIKNKLNISTLPFNIAGNARL